MSRYQWPSRVKNPDRPYERMRWRIATDGVLTDSMLSQTREAKAEARRRAEGGGRRGGPRAAPLGDENLWLPIGPSTVLWGQAGGHPRVAGRVRDIWVSPNGQRAYAATANGGVWFSGDGGTTWSPLGGWLATPDQPQMRRAATAMTCGCLLVNWEALDDSEDEVYVGTGELIPSLQGTPGALLGGVGVLRLAVPVPEALAAPFGNHWQREAGNLAGRGIYRLARDPNDKNVMVAATSIGLFRRVGLFRENEDWERVTADPFDFDADDGKVTTDVVWTPSRLYVALWGSDSEVWASEGSLDGPFESVDLPDVETGRIGLAGAPGDPTRVYALGAGPRLYQITGNQGRRVLNLPDALFGGTDDDNSWYDLAIGVHPTDSARVAVGGSAVEADNEWSASLFAARITTNADGDLTFGFTAANEDAPGTDGTYIGNGVHADVHQIRYSAVGPDVHVWVGCDGGLFRSVTGGSPRSFRSANTGLAVLQGGYVASHPENDAFVVLGTQDNGVLQRVGDSVWMHTDEIGGDGGAVLFHPTRPRYFVGQYSNATWNSNDLLGPPVLRRSTLANPVASETEESGNASFYSGADFQATPGPAGVVRLALGTNRVWVTEDWLPGGNVPNTWKTLPSGTDPRTDDPDDTGTDVLDSDYGWVIACRWAKDHRLFVLFERAVVMFTPPESGSVWASEEITSPPSHCGTWENDDIPLELPKEFLPPLGSWSDLALDEPTPGDKSLYVACTGFAAVDDDTVTEADRMDTLWWYDGAGGWHPTGLRNAGTGAKAPAYAVLVDPDDHTVVYVGTALGVWRGRQTAALPAPGWTWAPLDNGLPETAVQDLSLYNHDGVKLLRAALQARGVWEVDLSAAPTPTKRAYLRSYPSDGRRVSPATLANPMLSDPAAWPWFISPDIRVRLASNPVHWGAGEPTEADLLEIAEPSGLPFPGQGLPVANAFVNLPGWLLPMAGAMGLPRALHKVDVLVHYRDLTALAPDQVTVTLLRGALPLALPDWATVAVGADLKTRITELLTGPTPAGWAPPAGWALADTAVPKRNPNFKIDAGTPRVVTFEMDLASAGLPVALKFYVLLAVVSATPDPVSVADLDGATLRDLVLRSHHVAVRIIQA
jgi:hypothetical protein